MVKLILPRQLMQYTTLTDDFVCPALTLGQALESLVQSYPMLKPQIFNNDKTVRNFVNIFVNNEMIEDLAMPVRENSRIQIIVAVAGG
jgi:molybdopterin converting factor small subunit